METQSEQPRQDGPELAPTGVEGLDDVLCGGLVRNRFYLLGGDPGAGKTTIALQFLLQGVANGERCMFVALSESEDELRATAESHGWSLDGIAVLCISPTEANLAMDSRYTMYHSSEVELTETTKAVLTEADRVRPTRLVFDSLSELRLLAESPLRYRRQVLGMKQHFAKQPCTAIFITDQSVNGTDRELELQTIAHGVIAVERRSTDYGAMRRRLQVVKQRGREFRGGYHDVVIERGGLKIFPRLVASDHAHDFVREVVKSGLEPLDELLGGGLARGTSSLLLGAAGTGKSTVAGQYAATAAAQNERSAIFLFDESTSTYLTRSAGLGLGLDEAYRSGLVTIRQVDPAELTPGEFAHIVKQAVEEDQTRLIVIDSLNGYLNAMPSEQFLTLHLHELLSYLGKHGVTTLLLMAQHGLVGKTMQVPIDASYLADSVLLFRYFEAAGEVRKAISVIKNRTGAHERTIRELRLNDRLSIGAPLKEFHGVLNGTPEFVGASPSPGDSRGNPL